MYPELGSEVTFIRQDVESKALYEGKGIVVSVFLDPRNMPMARVKEGDNSYNVDLKAINAPEGFKEEYNKILNDVLELTKEGNEKAQAIVKEYNDKIDKIYEEFLK